MPIEPLETRPKYSSTYETNVEQDQFQDLVQDGEKEQVDLSVQNKMQMNQDGTSAATPKQDQQKIFGFIPKPRSWQLREEAKAKAKEQYEASLPKAYEQKYQQEYQEKLRKVQMTPAERESERQAKLQQLGTKFKSAMGDIGSTLGRSGISKQAPGNVFGGKLGTPIRGGTIKVKTAKGDTIYYPTTGQTPKAQIRGFLSSNINESTPSTNINQPQQRPGQKYFKVTSRTGKVYYRLMEGKLPQQQATSGTASYITPQQQTEMPSGMLQYSNKISPYIGGQQMPEQSSAADKIRMFTGSPMQMQNPNDKLMAYTHSDGFGLKLNSLMGSQQSVSFGDKIRVLTGSQSGSTSFQDKMNMFSLNNQRKASIIKGKTNTVPSMHDKLMTFLR